MFETQYNEEMATEVRRLEAKHRSTAAGHPEWLNACIGCGCELKSIDVDICDQCC